MSVGKRISIIIVDDHPVVLEGLKNLLENEEFFIAGSFIRGLQALEYIGKNKIEIALIDISIPDINGIELCKEIKKIAPETKVIGLSNHTERSIVTQLLQSGASGYLLKNITSEELHKSIKEVMAGEITFSSEVKKIIVLPPEIGETAETPKLTKREIEILSLIARGKTTQVIADELFVSPLTIETHRRNLLQKFKAKNMMELLAFALKNSII